MTVSTIVLQNDLLLSIYTPVFNYDQKLKLYEDINPNGPIKFNHFILNSVFTQGTRSRRGSPSGEKIKLEHQNRTYKQHVKPNIQIACWQNVYNFCLHICQHKNCLHFPANIYRLNRRYLISLTKQLFIKVTKKVILLKIRSF